MIEKKGDYGLGFSIDSQIPNTCSSELKQLWHATADLHADLPLTCEASDIHKQANQFKKLDMNDYYSQFNLNTPPDTNEDFVETPETMPLSPTSSTCSFDSSPPAHSVPYQMHDHQYSSTPINKFSFQHICSSPSCYSPGSLLNQKHLSPNDEVHSIPITYEIFQKQQIQMPCYCLYNNRISSSSHLYDNEDINEPKSIGCQSDCEEKLYNKTRIPSSSFVPHSSPIDTCESVNQKLWMAKYLSENRLKTPKNTKQQTNNVTHICPYSGCSKIFPKLAYLRSHQKVHLGLRPFHCLWPKCGWKFARADELKRHFRIHTGEKPFSCKYCDQAYTRSDHLTMHIKRHFE